MLMHCVKLCENSQARKQKMEKACRSVDVFDVLLTHVHPQDQPQQIQTFFQQLTVDGNPSLQRKNVL